MACPFFMPTERVEDGAWLHPGRLPLGAGWRGHCTAPGHAGEIPAQSVLEQSCNLGYGQCGQLPQDQTLYPWDAIRFSAITKVKHAFATNLPQPISPRAPRRIVEVHYVCERGHRPADHGRLEFDPASSTWSLPHADSRVQRMAECFLESYLQKQPKQEREKTS
jgi:hypothetical protein